MSAMSNGIPPTSRAAKAAVMLGVALLALVTAACGSTSSAGGPGGTAAAGEGGPGLAVADTSLGAVLVDAQGMTVYLLTADSTDKSSCSAQCLAYWPAVSGPATGGAGVVAKIGHTSTTGGGQILTANGQPLYTFVQDQSPGDVTGEGVQSFGGTWYAVSPDGQPVTAAAGSSGRSY